MAMKNVMLIEMLAENEDNSSKQYAADIYLPASIYEIDDDTDYILANMNEVETELQKYTSLDDINMVEYYDENSFVKDKLVSMDWEIREINDTPYGYVDVVLNAPLNDSEVDELKDCIGCNCI